MVRAACFTSSGVPWGRVFWRLISPQKVIFPANARATFSTPMHHSWELMASTPISMKWG